MQIDDQNTSPADPSYTPAQPDWERDLLARLAMSSLNEQRRARRWGIFFKSLTFIYITIFLLLVMNSRQLSDAATLGAHTAVIDVAGVIAPDTWTNAERIGAGLRAAFEHENTQAVIVRINSPGGSPVQSGAIYNEIMRLREQYKEIPLYAVIEDIGASGGYYIAAAAEKIYADKASIVGSIGVRMDGFGFVEAIKTLGVERRLLTAGENKAMLDPFLPQDEQERLHLQGLLNEVHQQFIQAVRRGRGERLQPQDSLFSGLVWTGEKAVQLGLVDGLGSVQYVAREVVKQEHLRDFTPREDFFERLTQYLGASLPQQLLQQLQAQRIN